MIDNYSVTAEATKDSDQKLMARVLNPERFTETESNHEFYCAGMLVSFEKRFNGTNVIVIKD